MQNENILKKLRWYFLAGLAGFLVYALVFPRLDDLSNLQLKYSEDQVKQKIADLAQEFHVDLTGLKSEISLRRNTDITDYTQKNLGLRAAIDLMKKGLPAYHWHVAYKTPKSKMDTTASTIISLGGDQPGKSNRRGDKTVTFRISTDDRLLSFIRNFPPDTVTHNLAKITAESAEKILQQQTAISSWKLLDQQESKRQRRIFNHFRWVTHQVTWTDSLIAVMNFRSNDLVRFDLSTGILQSREKKFSADDFWGIFKAVFVLIFSIIVLINLMKRLRQDKIEFKNAWIIGGIAAFMTILKAISGLQNNSFLEVVLGALLGAPFLGVFAFILVAVAESVARDVWNEKLSTYDRLLLWRLSSGRLGASIITGFFLSGIFLGVQTLILVIGDYLGPVWLKHAESQIRFCFSPIHFLQITGNGWLFSIFTLFAVVLLGYTFLRRFINKNLIFIIAAASILSFLPVKMIDVGPVYLQIIVNFISGLILVLAFLRFDFLTVFVAFSGAVFFAAATPYLSPHSSLGMMIGIFTLIFPVAFLVIGLAAIRSKDDGEDEQEYVPVYLRRWRERERLHRELEIARTVQLKFLPQSQPDISWLDVASNCTPAYEVGGDYFDFLPLDDDRFGVVVGDVSGKGVSAAFYMTLMKGILKSQTRHVQSPREVLVQINDLFYENAQRGVFISMIYGVFDRKKKLFTFARAGHNPIISIFSQKNQVKEISPKGIAIGLDKGLIFNRTLEESEIEINTNDIFVFYTDGYSEAMDKKRNEFGEQRLIDIVNRNRHLQAGAIIAQIQKAITEFTGDVPQHDDMTMVIVKIK